MENRNKLLYILLYSFVVVFVLIISKGLNTPQPGDENVYYYMGSLISEGKIPYKDFFFAHPPLQVYLIALAYKIFGFKVAILKSLPLASTLISSFLIYKIAKEKFGYAAAMASFLLFIFSYSIMFNSVFSFGVEIAAMLLVAGTYFLWNKNNYFLSGIFFGFAGVTRLLSLVPIAVILAAVFLSNRKKFFKLLPGFLAIFLLVNGTFVLLFGQSYLTPVYTFHLMKSLGSSENVKEYLDIIKLNWVLFLSASLFIFAKEKKPIGILVLISVIYLAFLMGLKKIFGFYFILVFPFLALIAGYSLIQVFQRLRLPKMWKVAISTAFLLIFTLNLIPDILFLERFGFAGFERGRDLSDFINKVSSNDTLLFGDDSVVPLLALQTDKKIALNFVDTNDQVFASGVQNLDDTLTRLRGKNILFIIRNKQGISHFASVRVFLSKNCEFLSQFHDEIEGDYLVYGCN
ncbi:MAG: glycosyltransferase family 39 protein [Nanoarchaeota archaeon]